MQKAVAEDLAWVSKMIQFVKRTTWLWGILGCVLVSRLCIYPLTPWGQWAQANYINEVWGGTVELVVPAERGVRGGELSPDGKWLIWAGYNREGKGQRFLINLLTNEEYDIDRFRPGKKRWLPNDQLLMHDGYDYWFVQLPTMEVIHNTEVISDEKPPEEINQIFNGKENIYIFEGFSVTNSGAALVSLDTDSPLVYSRAVDVIKSTFSFSFILISELWIDDLSPHTSPDGKWIAYTEETMLADLYVKDAVSGEVVATVKKSGRGVRLLGWSPDSKGFYFVFEVGGAAGGILSPSEPVFKLVLDPALAP